jgi:hypothetical protein
MVPDDMIDSRFSALEHKLPIQNTACWRHFMSRCLLYVCVCGVWCVCVVWCVWVNMGLIWVNIGEYGFNMGLIWV